MFNTTEEIIQDMRAGKMVIMVDDEDRENEGDLLICAEKVSTEGINFMAKFGRGLICLTLTKERCEHLKLPLMVMDTADKHATNFTVSIEAARGVTTGISAADRAKTIQAAAAANATATDIVQPGHIFPIMAQPGGVLTRAGHTEAGCDLARLAGFEPACVIVEILNEDGSMARRSDLEVFAKTHQLKIGTIADLINYRLQKEETVERVTECKLKNHHGEFRMIAFRDNINKSIHFACVKGTIVEEKSVLVRVHMHDFLADVLQVQRDDCSWPLTQAMKTIGQDETGVVVILNKKSNPDDLIKRMYNYQLQDEGVFLPKSDSESNLRMYGIGAQILVNLGIKKMRVLSTPKKLHALSGFGLEVEEYVKNT